MLAMHGPATGDAGNYSSQAYHKDLLVTVERFYFESCKYEVKSMLLEVVGWGGTCFERHSKLC